MNRGYWNISEKKFEFTQNLHEFERIRAILEKLSEISKIFHFSFFLKLGCHNKLKCLVKNRNFEIAVRRVSKIQHNFHHRYV